MTEYDYSPQAYQRYLSTQNRIANWVDKTEQHRGEFQSANAGSSDQPPDLTRSGPGPASHSKFKRSSRRQHSGQSQPKQLVVHQPPESDSSSSSSGYYEGPWPAPMHQPNPGMVLPPMQQQPLPSPPPMMMAPAFVTSPHRVSHHHRHRSHDRRRSHSHHSPTYYNLASPPLSPDYQYTYPGGNQGYVMMPPYSGTQMPVMSTFSQQSRSAPASVTEFSVPTTQLSYLQPQPVSSQPSWSTYGTAASPAYSVMSTAIGSPPLPYPAVPTYQSFSVQQPVQPPYLIPPGTHQRIYDLSKPDKYYKRTVG